MNSLASILILVGRLFFSPEKLSEHRRNYLWVDAMTLALNRLVSGARHGFGKPLGRHMHERQNLFRCAAIHNQRLRGYSGSSIGRDCAVAQNSSVVGKRMSHCFH
jgi:hypothetical protein